MRILKKLEDALDYKSTIIKAKLIKTEGSVPRETGTYMLISSKYIFGSIGGGQLEFDIINKSKNILEKNTIFKEQIINIPLGPAIGQCCGGYTQIKITKHKNGKECFLNEKKINDNFENLYVFGAGHIGREICMKSIDLDFNINLIDSREDFIKNKIHKKVTNIFAKYPWLIVKNLPKNSYFLVLTHSHSHDFNIINELLNYNNYKFAGLIGSKTKMKRFQNRLLKLNHDISKINNIECPIGIKSITSKKPPQIAISIIARLLEFRSNFLNKRKNSNIFLKKINE